MQPKAKRPRKTKAGSNATVEEHADADPVDNAQADVPANEEDDAGWVHQEDPAGDAHEEDHAGENHQEGSASDQEDGHGRGEFEFEFDHGLTLDQNEKYY